MKAKLLGYIPCNSSNASHLLSSALAALPLVCSLACLQVSEPFCCWRFQEAGGIKPQGFFYEPNVEKGAFQWLQPPSQVLPGGLHTKLRLWSYSLEFAFVFSLAKFLVMGR